MGIINMCWHCKPGLGIDRVDSRFRGNDECEYQHTLRIPGFLGLLHRREKGVLGIINMCWHCEAGLGIDRVDSRFRGNDECGCQYTLGIPRFLGLLHRREKGVLGIINMCWHCKPGLGIDRVDSRFRGNDECGYQHTLRIPGFLGLLHRGGREFGYSQYVLAL